MTTRVWALGAALLAGLAGVAAQEAVREVSLLIVDATIVTVDAERRVIENGAVAIDGPDIVAVGTTETVLRGFRGRDTIDASGQIVLPGLINTHTHAPMVLDRGLADDLPPMDRRHQDILPGEATSVSRESVRAGARLAMLEMIQSGTTTFADMYYFEEEVAAIAKAAGLRGVLGQTVIQYPASDAPTPADALARAEAFITAFRADPLITPAVAPHGLYALDGPTLLASRELSRRYGVPTLIHLAETRDEVHAARERFRSSPVAYLDGLGFLGPGVLAAHAVWVSEPDVSLLKARGVGVSHNPVSHTKLGSGVAPVPAFLRADLALGLGTDAAPGKDLDMFEAMRTASLLHRVHSSAPAVVSARDTLDMATIGGARALRMQRQIGSLEPGKRADVIVVGMSAPPQPWMGHPVPRLVHVTRKDDVRTTIVHGQVLMRDREMLTLDERAVRAEARAWAARINAGLDQTR